MKQAEITKVLNKIKEQPSEYSLGFKRICVLPVRVRRNINSACVMRGEINDSSMKALFNEMSEQEFINWLELA